MTQQSPHTAPRRLTTATLLAAALSLHAPHASAIDWDGDFPVDGDFSGKIDNPANWQLNFLPTASTGVSFNPNATYTVGFGVDFETAGGTVENGAVTFESLGGIRTYAINGRLTVTSELTLDDVVFAAGQNQNMTLHVEAGGEVSLMGGQSNSGTLRVGDSTSGGTLTLNNAGYEINSTSILMLGTGLEEALITVDNGSVLSTADANVLVGRVTGTQARIEVLGGSTLAIDGNLLMTDIIGQDGSGILEIFGNGSSLQVQGGGDTIIGNTSAGSARITLGNLTQATFGDQLTVEARGTFQNQGSTATVGGAAIFAGTFSHAAGSTTFNDTATFSAGATFIHNGGTIRFRDASTLAIQDVTIGAPTSGNPAAWDIDADVAYNRLLRLAGDNGTFATVTVEDIGGVDAVLRNTGTGGQADLAVGFNGSAQLYISDRGQVDIYDDVIIGQNAGSIGQVFVTGDGSANNADRSNLRVNRNGSGSNLFVGFEGDGFLSVAGGGHVQVGNDLVVMLNDVAGISSTVSVGVAQSLALDSTDTVTIGNDLLIGNNGALTGTSSGLYWHLDGAMTTVGRTTHVRATGELRTTVGSTLLTTNLTTDVGAQLNIDGGYITINGGTATFNHGDLLLNGDESAVQGQSLLHLINGATAVLDGDLILADAPGEFGLLFVQGAGSSFTQTGGLKSAYVAAGGRGQIRVTSGGFAEFNVEVHVGQGSDAFGYVQVSGVDAGTRSTLVVDNLNDASFLRLGEDGARSRMDIEDGGLVQVGNAVFVGSILTPSTGTHELNIGGAQAGFNAELRAKFLTTSGLDATTNINDGALVMLTSNTPFSQLQAFNSGEINITGGEVFAPQVARDSNSTINWTGGILHTEEVQGDLTNAGGTLAPGQGQAVSLGTTTFTADYTQTAAGTLEIEIVGNAQGTEYDFVDVNGQLTLAGTLEVVLLGPAPTPGDSYDILDWGTRIGTFDTLDLPGVGNGNTWSLDYLYTTGVLEVIRSGDLNSDGLVGAADLDIILANWGQNVTPFDETMGDVNGDGLVDNDDLQAVLDQFGNTTYPGSTMVPEPGSLALLSMLLFGVRRRRR